MLPDLVALLLTVSVNAIFGRTMEHGCSLLHQQEAQAAAQTRLSTMKRKKKHPMTETHPQPLGDRELPEIDMQPCSYCGHDMQ